MRPVNLIPAEQRHGAHAQLRTGPLPYIVLGALALVLIGVAVLVTTDNRIAESKAEIVTLKSEDAAAQAKAQAARRLLPVPHPRRTAGRDGAGPWPKAASTGNG